MLVCRSLLLSSAVLLSSNLCAVAAEEAVDLGSVTKQHVMVPMRDGAKLSTYLYFPEGKFEDCVLHAGAYGINLPAPFTDVVTGHTYVRREVLEQVRFRDPDDKPFRKAEDYIFCMETLFKFRKSAIIDSVLSFYRPSAERGQNRHGYKNVTYVSV